ncbi:FecR family protein [Chitinophaga silvatica]|uniref:FecR family protein n=1 Tax=Chitinophaga silvatica TaxID=2282649 RepID=A0A3E1YEK4_9BACT|nr:FecR family protein [Chitinophaga silvatica]RFS24990.1 FecR family protein [Chitinophaga silvatica]
MQFKNDTIFFSAFWAGIVLMSCGTKTTESKLDSLKVPGITYHTYEGKIGVRTPVTLPDSSTVILNSATFLAVPDSFPGNRAVLLDGDAFFDVKPGKDTFTVTSDKLKATVLGTSFRMRSFGAQHGATFYLLNGQVRVSKSYYSATDNQPEILERGQMILANNEIDLMEKETYHPEELEAWLSDSLILKNITIMQLSRTLEDWFGVDVVISGDGSKTPDIKEQIFHKATLEDVLSKLSKDMHFTYKISSKGVKINL